MKAEGFKTLVTEQVILNVAQKAVVNFQLQVGAKDQTVTVDGSGLQVNTADASVSTVIDRHFVENLPLNGRSFQALLYLTPGGSPNVASANSDLAQGQFVVNGQSGDANYWMVDGASANIGLSQFQPGPGVTGALGGTNALDGTSALVSIDAMQEFLVQTSTYSPEFGRVMGGQISIQTRSGTNQFHGALFEYLRNGVLDAADWFADHNNLPKPLDERVMLQFRAELFNLLNHPNFGPFNNQFQSGNVYFGQAAQMLNQYLGGISGNGSQNPLCTSGSPRSGEFALKLVF